MLKKAIYLDPNYIEAIDMLAAIYQRLGDETSYQACINRGQRIISRQSRPIVAP
jgi:Tfp pilus assembly protein PilF